MLAFFCYSASDLLNKNIEISSILELFGRPGAPLAPFGCRLGPESRFSMNLGSIWTSCWRPWPTLGPPCAPPVPFFCARCPAFSMFFSDLGRRPDFYFILGCPPE